MSDLREYVENLVQLAEAPLFTADRLRALVEKLAQRTDPDDPASQQVTSESLLPAYTALYQAARVDLLAAVEALPESLEMPE